MRYLPLKLGIGVVVVFGLLFVGFLVYEPVWFKVQAWRIKSDDATTRDAAIKAVAEKGERALPHVSTWLKSSNSNLALGACHILVIIKKYFDEPVKNIVQCPQLNGPPIFAVFEEKMYGLEGKGKTKGHVMLIDHNGNTIRFYRGANVIEGAFKDVNNDGIIEKVDVIPCGIQGVRGYADILHVLPITKEQKPKLLVAHNKVGYANKWSWELVASGTPGIFDIELGPIDKKTDKVIPRIIYKWSVAGRKYEGPKGGIGLQFIRLDGEYPDPFSDFLKGKAQENKKKSKEKLK